MGRSLSTQIRSTQIERRRISLFAYFRTAPRRFFARGLSTSRRASRGAAPSAPLRSPPCSLSPPRSTRSTPFFSMPRLVAHHVSPLSTSSLAHFLAQLYLSARRPRVRRPRIARSPRPPQIAAAGKFPIPTLDAKRQTPTTVFAIDEVGTTRLPACDRAAALFARRPSRAYLAPLRAPAAINRGRSAAPIGTRELAKAACTALAIADVIV